MLGSRKNTAVSLVEVLVVVALLGILCAAVVVTIDPFGKAASAKAARAKEDLSRIGAWMEGCIINSGQDLTACNTWQKLYNGGFVSTSVQPAGIVIGDGCVSEAEAGGFYCRYQTGGSVTCGESAPCAPGS